MKIYRQHEAQLLYSILPLSGIVMVSGYFNPIHRGHINYINDSKRFGDTLIVVVNGDEASVRKRGYSLVPIEDRLETLSQFTCVDYVIDSNDSDMSNMLWILQPDFFCNGGDVTEENFNEKEKEMCSKYGIKTAFGVGGRNKIASSSQFMNQAFQQYKDYRGIK